ncbi:MAG: tetratricopeptide repeat protein [Cyanobacteria bacterium]|nr:tetratricopeptide repeat protein [Cyanobacteriota bacterium]
MSQIEQALSMAIDSHQKGNLPQAESIYLEILKIEAENPDALHLLGVLQTEKGEFVSGIQLIEKAIECNDNIAPFYNSLGLGYLDWGQYDKAVTAFQKAIALDSEVEEFYINLGNAYQHFGDIHQAIEAYNQAIERNPNSWECYNNLGNIHRALGNTELAFISLKTAILLNNDYFEAFYNLSSLYQQQNDIEQAILYCQKVIELNPTYAQGYDSMGSLMFQKGLIQDAEKYYRLAIEHDPKFIKAYLNLGTLQFASDQFRQSIETFEKLITIAPDHEDAICALGNAYYRLGDLEKSGHYFEIACRANPGKKLYTWRNETICPIFFDSEEQILSYRDHLMERLNYYGNLEFSVTLQDLINTGCQPSFFLNYQGQNERPIKEQYGNVFNQILEKQFPELLTLPQRKEHSDKIRVGFLVTEHHEGVFCKLTAGFINKLPREIFDIFVICSDKSKAYITTRVTHPETYYINAGKFLDCIETVKKECLDILLHYEVGTDGANYFLPFFNMAPVQFTTFGLPVTTGIPTMDYFLSSVKTEPENSQNYYTEKLIKFKDDPIYFYRPQLQQPLKTKEDFGLNPAQTFYYCPQNLFKFHSDFDPILAEILDQDPQGQIYLLESMEANWQKMFLERFSKNPVVKKNPSLLDRLKFKGRMNHFEYLNFTALADVMLDTIHYTGGTTSFEALSFGIPIVTMPFESTRSRQTLGNYRTMGVDSCVVSSTEAYIEKALKLGTDKDYRESIHQEILQHNDSLFENESVIEEMTAFLIQAYEKSLKSPKS